MGRESDPSLASAKLQFTGEDVFVIRKGRENRQAWPSANAASGNLDFIGAWMGSARRTGHKLGRRNIPGRGNSMTTRREAMRLPHPVDRVA